MGIYALQETRALPINDQAMTEFRSGQERGGIPASSSAAFDRLAQPLHCEFNVGRLQIAPAFDLCLISVFWEAPEILRGQLPGGGLFAGELFANEGIFGHAPLKRGPNLSANYQSVGAGNTGWLPCHVGMKNIDHHRNSGNRRSKRSHNSENQNRPKSPAISTFTLAILFGKPFSGESWWRISV